MCIKAHRLRRILRKTLCCDASISSESEPEDRDNKSCIYFLKQTKQNDQAVGKKYGIMKLHLLNTFPSNPVSSTEVKEM